MNIRKRYILLVKICEAMTKENLILSKISLHQLVYILQELYSLDNFYDFKLYTYGPYAVELTTDLDYLFSNDILKVEYCQGPSYFGSKIELGEKHSLVINQNNEMLDDEEKINEVVEVFGNNDARSLELRGTIIYLSIDEGISSLENIVERIRSIKPYFLGDEIEETVRELNDFIDIDY